jgi:hypothetical protein
VTDEPYNEIASRISVEREADIIFVNGAMKGPLDAEFASLLDGRIEKHKKVYVILVTEGGQGDVAYRACRALQMAYEHISVVVSGWCKSAGTLFCVGAHEIILGPNGEMGPIDVQLRRIDEIGERDSGLAIDAAFDGLSEAAFKLFEKFMLGIKERSRGSVTFKTAAEIAAQVAVGLVAPIFAQLDPMKVGEIHRSVRVAEEYGKRLSMIGQNLRRDLSIDPLDMLVRGYPSHGFVIDRLESHLLFKNVSPLDDLLSDLVDALGEYAIAPIDDDASPTTSYRMEYLNAEKEPQGAAGGEAAQQAPSDVKPVSPRAKRASSINGTPSELPGDVPGGAKS